MILRMTERSEVRRNSVESKRRILDAGEAEFAAKGFDGARLGTIARAAGVQQALIHHYFVDKAGLYEAVAERAIGAITTEGWDILARTVNQTGGGVRLSAKEVRPLVEEFIALLQRFFSEHAPILAIVRHETEAGEKAIVRVVRARVKPVFDAVTGYLDQLKEARIVREDVDVRHLCLDALSMVGFPMMEKQLLTALWPVDPTEKWLLGARHEIVETLLVRLLP
jgi:AcrR family transcriptional regulator